jgi:hypothetical protein
VTCRLTFGQEILCCCGIVGNVSQREPRNACTASRQAEIAGKCHSADGLCERQMSWSRGGYEDREWSEESVEGGDRVGDCVNSRIKGQGQEGRRIAGNNK